MVETGALVACNRPHHSLVRPAGIHKCCKSRLAQQDPTLFWSVLGTVIECAAEVCEPSFATHTVIRIASPGFTKFSGLTPRRYIPAAV